MPRPTATEPDLSQLLSAMLESSHHITVAEIEQQLASQQRSYNKTSIYRALDKMIKADLVCRHQLNDHEARYELRSHHHAHLVCESCGRVAEAPCRYRQPRNYKGFKVDHHHLTLVGLCSDCQES